MKRIAILSILFTISLCAFSQYNRPYRVIYEPTVKGYFISNQGSGSILHLDSNYRTQTVITGLTKPKDLATIFVGSIKLLFVVDDNKLKLYDSAYKLQDTYTITGATDAEDIELDPRDPNFFYVSDVGGNKILKGRIGTAPFYTPSFKTLTGSGLSRPKGLLFNRSGELLVVTDESKGKIIQVDTASGGLNTKLSTGLDSLNSITQDGQGNYFITNWGDSYSYRCDSKFGNLTKLTSYNKPAGLVANIQSDLLVLLCHLCNKVEYHKLHYFEPNGSSVGCPGDSTIMQLAIAAQGIGTYEKGNQFVVELSDDKGDFGLPYTLGSLDTAIQPDRIPFLIPKTTLASGYKIRIKSLIPEFVSSAVSITTLDWPTLAGVRDSVIVCSGDEIRLGEDSASQTDYEWTSAFITDSTISNPWFLASDSGFHSAELFAKNRLTGCDNMKKVSVYVRPPLTFDNLVKTHSICVGEEVQIGTSDSFSMEWRPGVDLSDSLLSNPIFSGDTTTTKYVFGYHQPTGCFAIDSVQIVVYSKPDFEPVYTYRKVCDGANILLKARARDSLTSFHWTPARDFNTPIGDSVYFMPTKLGENYVQVRATTQFGCEDSADVLVFNNPLPEWDSVTISAKKFPMLDVSGGVNMTDSMQPFALHLYDAVSDSGWTDQYFEKLPAELTVKDTTIIPTHASIVYWSDSLCGTFSEQLELKWLTTVGDVSTKEVRIFPNPASSYVNVESEISVASVKLYNQEGRVVHVLYPKSTRFDLDIADLATGSYIIELFYVDGRLGRELLLKSDL